ncbi:MAG TPA: hypothetical protein VKZ44_00165 [Taishania sp.]|nr:hypothetical protein [Taishania sp.]
MQQNYSHIFKELPDTSRVWIYQNQSVIPQNLRPAIQAKLDEFTMQWAAHKVQLFAQATILEDYFLVLAVDESVTQASGCSIDSSVHFIKELEKEFNLNLFDRLHVLVEENNEKKVVHFSELSGFPNAYLYNPLITTLGDLRNKWKIKVSDFSH